MYTQYFTFSFYIYCVPCVRFHNKIKWLTTYFSQGTSATDLRGDGSYNSSYLRIFFLNLTVKKIMKMVHFHRSYRKNNKKLSYRWQTARHVKRSVKITKHGTIPYVSMVSYYCAIVTLSVRLTVFFRNSTSKIVVKVSENVTIRYRAYDFLLTFYCNYGSIWCRFWVIQCRKISRPWNPSQKPIKVIESDTIR